ncbi:MAG: AAA family ATPase [Methanobrevibacter sp.]|nr:AAA family ATPase [Methanobrevibacter sp.]
MILKSLYLKNYRTYRGPEIVDFATGDQNITIIKGNNEVGKTTIMNAITWCLYGREYYRDKGNEPIFSKSTSYDLEIGDEDTVEVKLEMEDTKGKTVKFIRKLLFYKNDLGQCKEDSTDFEILVDEIPVTFQSTYIKKHLPSDIKEYFLFDGEQLESYFTEDNSNIKKSVYQLSHLNVLENTIKHLKASKRDLEDQLSKLNPVLGKLRKNESRLVEDIESNNAKLVKIDSDVANWNRLISENSDQIKHFGQDPNSLIDEKESLKEELKKIDNRIEKEEERYGIFLIKNLPKIMSAPYLLNVKDLCKELEEKGFIPARFKKEFLEYLLEEHECICGADLSEGSPGHDKLLKLYNETDEATNIADHVNLLLGSLNSIIDKFPLKFENTLKSKRSTIQEFKFERDNISKSITDINNKLAGIDEDKVKELQKEIEQYETLISINTEKKGGIKKQIELDEKLLVDVRADIVEEEKKAGIKNEIQSSLNLCNEVLSEVKTIYHDLEEDIHIKLQDLTSNEFSNMHWKDFYEGVVIDKDYDVKILKEGGYVVPNDLSKGGQLVLALSFMTALNSLSGFGLPIVIDTPLGRLDEPIKENIGKNLHEYTKNKQVTLLVTGSEYSDEFRKGIRDHVGKEYELNYIQEKDGITTIECKK